MELNYWVHSQRNEINHAYRGEDVASSSEIEEKMMMVIQYMEELEKRE